MSTLWLGVLAAFLLAHGLIHLGYLAPAPVQKPGEVRYPFDATRSWMGRFGASSDALKAGAIILATATVLLYATAALSMLGWFVPGAWFAALLTSATVNSLVLLALYWDTWFVVGAAIDVALLAALYAYDLPGKVAAVSA